MRASKCWIENSTAKDAKSQVRGLPSADIGMDKSNGNNMRVLLMGIIGALVGGSARAQVVDYCHSGDFSAHVLYFSTNIAVAKVIHEAALGQVFVTYTIAKAHQGPTPELALDPGWIVDKDISTSLTR